VGSEKVENGPDVSCLVPPKFSSLSFLLPAQFGSDPRLLCGPSLNLSELKSRWPWRAVNTSVREILMFDNYVIEVRPPTSGLTFQAGIIVRDGGSFRFFAASQVFQSLEGRRFDGPQTAEKAALRRMTDVAARRPPPMTKPNQGKWDRL
jgi:hypothetical protein